MQELIWECFAHQRYEDALARFEATELDQPEAKEDVTGSTACIPVVDVLTDESK